LIIPLLNIESDFSLAFGGLIMNGVALAIVLRVIRRTGLRARHRMEQPQFHLPILSESHSSS
jgi:hypothetical protein